MTTNGAARVFLTKSDRLLKDAMTLSSVFEHDEPKRNIHQRTELSFVMYGIVVNAKPNVLFLFKKEYRCYFAFHQNNVHRKTACRRMTNLQIIYGIIMVGTVPTHPSPRSSSAVQCPGWAVPSRDDQYKDVSQTKMLVVRKVLFPVNRRIVM